MELICYLSNGYPTIEDSIKTAQAYVEAGCDAIEVDFPGRNPFLESEYLADRMAKALEACGDYRAYMAGIERLKRLLPHVHYILLLYEDTLREIGCQDFLEFCRKNGLCDLILVGEAAGVTELKERLIREGLHVSCYVQYALLDAEVDQAKNSNGFVYMQAKPAGGVFKYPSLKDCIAFLRSQGIDRPIYCGVGIHRPEDAAMAKAAGADGIFVGSGILKLQHDRDAMVRAIRAFKARC